jgi:hypothetical protein
MRAAAMIAARLATGRLDRRTFVGRSLAAAGTFRIESWPWDADPSDPGAAQFPGWPVSVRYT